eukprot:11793683-Karenia_brevis.AAC.1
MSMTLVAKKLGCNTKRPGLHTGQDERQQYLAAAFKLIDRWSHHVAYAFAREMVMMTMTMMMR